MLRAAAILIASLGVGILASWCVPVALARLTFVVTAALVGGALGALFMSMGRL